MTRFVPTLFVLVFAALPVQAQVRSYYYGQPPSTRPVPFDEGKAVVYGAGQGSPVAFGTPGSVYYSPGYAPSFYRTPNATYTPPGLFDPRPVAVPVFASPATYTYTPGYYSYSFTPSLAPTEPLRPISSRPRVYFGLGQTYR